MIRAWRIVKTRFAAEAFSGEGARLYGGRWNSHATPVVYAAGSQSLATLELLVHLDNISVLPSYSICPIDFDESLVESLDRTALPSDWRESPAPTSLQLIGDDWIFQGSSVVLAVPSAVIDAENNYLINPAHKNFKKLLIGKMGLFKLDARLRQS